jgi:hypothetical protein
MSMRLPPGLHARWRRECAFPCSIPMWVFPLVTPVTGKLPSNISVLLKFNL